MIHAARMALSLSSVVTEPVNATPGLVANIEEHFDLGTEDGRMEYSRAIQCPQYLEEREELVEDQRKLIEARLADIDAQ